MRRFIMPTIKRSTSVGVIFLVLMIDGSITTVSTTSGPHFDGSTRDEQYAVDLIADLMNRSSSHVRPGVYGPPTEVKIDFFVQTFGPLNEVDMEFSTDLDFRQTWHDPRFNFSSRTPGFDDPVYIPEQKIEKFWIPDLYFPNDKHGIMHQITIPNRSIRIYPNGTIRYFTRMAMRLSCTMYLDKFPLDSQICFIKISTYSYDSKEVILSWLDNAPIEIHPQELQLPQFAMINYTHENCIENYKTGNYSCIQATFFLERRIGFFVLQTYIPSILIVVLSWVGFWINKDSEPARIALGVTTVLTMTTQLTTSRSNTMRVSYLKAIDVWYSSCMLFVFAALLEYAFVNANSRRERNTINRSKKYDGKVDDVEMQRLNDCDSNNRKAPTATPETDCGSGEDVSNAPATGGVQGMFGGAPAQLLDECWRRLTGSCRHDSEGDGGAAVGVSRERAKWSLSCASKSIDRFSRRVFPISFGLFNLIYWLYYLTPPHFHCLISSHTSPDNCIGHEDDSFQFMFDGKRQEA